MKLLLRTAFIFLLAAGAHAAQTAVVRPAPNFAIAGATRGASLKSFHGQPVVIVFARRASERALRSQAGRLERLYSQFAGQKVIFIAVIQDGSQDVRTNIPFSVAANPAQVAADYGVTGSFAVAVVGKDGNLDLITTHEIPASRVNDAISNAYENQAAERASS